LAPDAILTVQVTDDGSFDPEAAMVGSGIATMQTLAAFVEGHVDIDRAPGRGTCIRAVLGAPAVTQPAAQPHLQPVTDST
jgi:signal transduction histidine kinase